jgi:hypothetical protein
MDGKKPKDWVADYMTNMIDNGDTVIVADFEDGYKYPTWADFFDAARRGAHDWVEGKSDLQDKILKVKDSRFFAAKKKRFKADRKKYAPSPFERGGVRYRKITESKQMDEDVFWKKAEAIDKKVKRQYKKEIHDLIHSESDAAYIYQSYEDIAYYAMENAMPGENNFTKKSLDLYANGLESIITETK